MYEIAYGAKYDKTLSRVQIASKLRAEIKAMVKAGILPKGKYSVRCGLGGGRSIDIRVEDLEGQLHPYGFLVHGSDYLMGPSVHGIDGKFSRPSRYLPWVNDLLKTLRDMMAAYNFDGSDIQSDYFNVNFYGDAKLDSGWEHRRLAEEKDGLEVAE